VNIHRVFKLALIWLKKSDRLNHVSRFLSSRKFRLFHQAAYTIIAPTGFSTAYLRHSDSSSCEFKFIKMVEFQGIFRRFYLNVAKVGGIQRQGVKGEAVVNYRKPLTTPDLKPSGFPEG